METNKYTKLACMGMKIREKALEAIQSANSGHVGGSFSVADILAVLYFDQLQVNPDNQEDRNRDRLVLSKGHCSPALYAALALKGYFPAVLLKTFRKIDSNLSGHVEMTKIPGVDMSAGSLGQGLSAAVGMAVAGQVDKRDYRVYAILGDGEIQEGQIWEAAMAAGHYKLSNLTAFVDNNHLQIDGAIDEVMSPYPIEEKFKAFGWHTVTVDGHAPQQLVEAILEAKQCKEKPTVIVAKTIKGKGVSYMENCAGWHGKTPNKEQYEQAFVELAEQIRELEG